VNELVVWLYPIQLCVELTLVECPLDFVHPCKNILVLLKKFL